jgi:type II secretory pathway pseudopilin PulG
MKTYFCLHRRNRVGFTLVEMLTVMAILIILLGLMVLLLPGWQQQGRARAGASQLQQWLLIAKQRAVLDQAPRGVRLLPDEDDSDLIVKAQFIEQPDDFSGGRVSTDTTGSIVTLESSNLEIDAGDPDQTLWLVQPGDHIQIGGSGLVRQIATITGSDLGPYQLTVSQPFPYAITTKTENYRIIRSPRVQGDEVLELPLDVAIDLKASATHGGLSYTTGQPIDIMFTPSGAILNNLSAERIIFWVRDITDPANEFDGSPSLIVVFTRSGLVNSYELDPELHSSNPLVVIR